MDRTCNLIGIQRLAAIYQRLLVIERFNTTPRHLNENIASHMYLVALLCVALSEGKGVNVGKTLEMCLIHDSDESYSGDIVANLKRFHPNVARALSDASEEFLDIIIDDIPISNRWRALWKEYKERVTPEAKLVKAADCVSQIISMAMELKLGNTFAKVAACNAMFALRENTNDQDLILECEEFLHLVGVDCTEQNCFEQWEM